MCRYKAVPESGNERGYLLMELAVSLPIFVLLLTFLAFALVWSWRNYRYEIADAELQQEMQIVAVRIVESALTSDHVRQRRKGFYEMRQAVKERGGGSLDQYWINDGRLFYKAVTGPITGGFVGARVYIDAFLVQEDPLYPRLYHIEMTGTSTVTGRTYSISTSVYLREDMGGT